MSLNSQKLLEITAANENAGKEIEILSKSLIQIADKKISALSNLVKNQPIQDYEVLEKNTKRHIESINLKPEYNVSSKKSEDINKINFLTEKLAETQNELDKILDAYEDLNNDHKLLEDQLAAINAVSFALIIETYGGN